MKRPSPRLKKPSLVDTSEVLDFAEGADAEKVSSKTGRTVSTRGRSGQVPAGDVRLSANVRKDLHLKLKIAAAKQRTTIGELIERLIEDHL